LSQHQGCTSIRLDDIHKDPDGGRLAGTIGAKKAEDFAAFNLEAEVLYSVYASVRLLKHFHTNH
jgi:hypothetical protein